ncbi:MAG: biotin synthase BioB, partial [Candidatus Marinimicrobia bacterium]|nr:biotin synthase BioB [Candidatus Neomarinimicrobiota bacterium]
THTYDDEREAVVRAKEAGFRVCCGGIFGMGETIEQRIELLEDMRALDVDSVPLNFLNPIEGTPLADKNDLTPMDCLKIIAVTRLFLQGKDIFVCGGHQYRAVEMLFRPLLSA